MVMRGCERGGGRALEWRLVLPFPVGQMDVDLDCGTTARRGSTNPGTLLSNFDQAKIGRRGTRQMKKFSDQTGVRGAIKYTKPAALQTTREANRLHDECLTWIGLLYIVTSYSGRSLFTRMEPQDPTMGNASNISHSILSVSSSRLARLLQPRDNTGPLLLRWTCAQSLF